MIASLIILLHFLGIISLESAYISLYFAGILLLIAEIGVVSFGLLAVNGLLALYAASSLHMGYSTVFGMTIGWPLFFGIAFVEALIIIVVIVIHMRLRRMKSTTGTENMIGQKAVILDWEEKKGRVRFEGEIWKAKSEHKMELSPDDEVTISSVNKLNLTITA